MKKIFFILLITHCLLQIVLSQTEWVELNSGTNQLLYSVHFPNVNTGYVLGSNSIILKTTNGGVNWLSLSSLTYQYPNRIVFTSPDTGYVSVNNGVFKTTNGGLNWSVLNANTQFGLYDLSFPSKDTGYGIGGDPGINIRKTTNGGNTWINQYVSLNMNYYLNNIYFVNNTTGYIVGDYYQVSYSSVFLKTTNGGINWTYQYFSSPSYSYSCIHFVNQNTGIIGFGYNGMRRTTDGGQSWVTYLFIHEFLRRMYFPSESTGFIVGSYNSVYKTSDTGMTWIMTNNGVNASLTDVFFVNNNTGYIVGYGGKIYKTTTGGITAIQLIPSEIPDKFSLSQNYPNPFNPTTVISFSIGISSEQLAVNSFVSLKIYGVLGREITTLVNEQLKPGIYKTAWDASNFASGIYYYKLFSGNYSETKKMVLIK